MKSNIEKLNLRTVDQHPDILAFAHEKWANKDVVGKGKAKARSSILS
jgi:hypothetical protein